MSDLDAVSVRPIRAGERDRFDVVLDEHQWLGHRLVGETMRYVALGPDGEWLAVLGFGASALACKPRDRYIGWSDEQHFARLAYVTNNQRFCVLPAGRRKNLASNWLAKTLKRLSGDFEVRWGHPVLMVETCVDPSRHRGTCYTAAGFALLGRTLGYGRSGGSYHHHGRVKLTFARLLRRDARAILTAQFDHLLLTRGSRPVIDLNSLDFDSRDGLLAALEQIVDHRKRRGCATASPRCSRSRPQRRLLAREVSPRSASTPSTAPSRCSHGSVPASTRSDGATSLRTPTRSDGRWPQSTRRRSMRWSARGCFARPVPDMSTPTSSCSLWTASRCVARCERTAVQCTCSPRWCTAQGSWSDNRRSTTSPTRSPRSSRCSTVWTFKVR